MLSRVTVRGVVWFKSAICHTIRVAAMFQQRWRRSFPQQSMEVVTFFTSSIRRYILAMSADNATFWGQNLIKISKNNFWFFRPSIRLSLLRDTPEVVFVPKRQNNLQEVLLWCFIPSGAGMRQVETFAGFDEDFRDHFHVTQIQE